MSYTAFGNGVPRKPGTVDMSDKSLPPSCGTVEETQKMLNKVGVEVEVTGELNFETALGITAFGLEQGFKEGDDPDLICQRLVEVSGGPGTDATPTITPPEFVPPVQTDSGNTKYLVAGGVAVGAVVVFFLLRKQ